MTTPRVSLCYIDPDWKIEVTKPRGANGRQYSIEIDRVEILVAEHLFPQFLGALRDHLEAALSKDDLALTSAHKERASHVREVGL